ncbi:MAG: type I polyketide synthase, partial [Acidobacteriota bacterium]|nr:type I polyketide synthase [Acidobacteriota bacterium]
MNEHRAPTEVTDLPTAIAIVGMAGRFPLAPTLDHLWRILVEGKEAVTFFSREELLEQGIPQEVLDLPNYVPAAAPVEQVEHFDAAFFGFTPNEAMVMDPQQRLFLECAWEAAEHAGCLGRHSDLRVGVFAGSSSSSYREYFLAAAGAVARRIGEMQAGLLNDRDMLPTQISYRLGLTGISSLVQCGCSTSMLAVHMACQSVLSGECDVALAGGVSIPIPQVAGYVWEEGSVSSPDGHTRSFDARAEGAQGGSGVGVVALRRLQDALDSGDHIHAVIRATAANNDGGHRIGFTAPSVEGQRRVIAESLALAEVDAETIGYVEAHGSATPLGDPIEIAALTRAFRSYTDRRGFCAVGSVKSNVGHLDEAAGIAGLIKATMAVEHGIVPPSLNFSEPNPKIDFAASPFYVNTETSPWPRQEGPRRAGVSSFGLGGTNIHAVLEEAPRRPSDPSRRSAHILPLSAKTAEALRAAEQRLAEHLGDHPDLPVADVAFTLQTGRRELPHRSYVVAASAAEAVEKLTAGDARRGTEAVAGTSLRISFLFPGVGDHHPAMARRLYRQEPVFQRCLDRCAEALKETLGVDLRDLLLAPAADEPGESSGGEPDLRALLSRPTRP